MDKSIALLILSTVSLCINFIVVFTGFPTRYSKRLSIFVAALSIIAYQIANLYSSSNEPYKYAPLISLEFLAVLIYLFKRPLFQKVFVFIVHSLLMVSAAAFSHNLIGLLIPFENNAFLLVFLLFALLLNFAYLGLAIKFGRQFMDKLFGHGSNVDWALYSIWTLFTYGIFLMHRHMPGSHALHIALWLFIPWTIALICYLVIAIHRRMRLEHEHALAREILSSGRAYYDKLTSMTEHLRHLHHDYKHQLNSIQKMLETDHSEDVQEYLIKLNAATKNDIIYNYCNNQVLNALLSSFAERCEREGIFFSVKIILPSSETIDNYELCIIIGNLLENALSACIRTPEGRKRYIDLSMRPREDNYGIKVENSYDGVLKHEDKQLFSTKKNGGFGIKSIKSVTKRHSGEYIPVWDDEKFSAFVLLKQCDSLLA